MPSADRPNGRQWAFVASAWGRLPQAMRGPAAMAIVDQAVVSGVSFLTTILIGRFTNPEQLGLYSLATSLVLGVLVVQTSLITMPFALGHHRAAGSDDAASRSYAGSTLLIQIALTGLVIVALLGAAVLADGPRVTLMWAMLLATPFLLLREFARRMAYAWLSVPTALAIDLPVGLLQTTGLAALAAIGALSASGAMLVLGVASAVGVAIAATQTRRQFLIRPVAFQSDLRRSWDFGRWVAGAQLLGVVNTQGTLWLIALISDTASAGVFAACLAVVLLCNPLMLAVGNLLTPRAAQALARDGHAAMRRLIVRAAAALAAALGLFCIVLLLCGDWIMWRLYEGQEYTGHTTLLVLLGLTFLLSAVGMAVNDGIRAMGRADLEFASTLLDTLLTIALGAVGLLKFGLVGLGWAMLIGSVAAVAYQIAAFVRISRAQRGEHVRPIALARYLPRFRQAERRLATLAEREKWSAARVAEHQLRLLNDLWAHASANVPYYRELAAAHRLPPLFDSIEHFKAVVPLVEKESVRRRPDDFRWPGAPTGRWRSTSGSTGTPMRFYASDATHQAVLSCQYRFRQLWDLDLFDRAAFLGAGAARQALTDWMRNRIRLSVLRLGPDDLAHHLDRIDRFGPAYLYGYSRAIHLLAEEAQRRGFRCPSLRVIMMTSEPAFAHMVAAVERAFGVPAVIEYGSTECGVTAYEWRDRTLRVRADRVLMETLPREDGRYDIVQTILDNPDFPLLRYRIEDLTEATIGNEPFPVLRNVIGRNDDVIYAAGGVAIHPAEIDGIFEGQRRSSVNIRRYRVHQNANGNIDVQVESASAVGGRIDLDAVRAAIAKVIPGRDVRVEVMSEIPQTASGKHRAITSDLRGSPGPTRSS